jgi:hypothetical protein
VCYFEGECHAFESLFLESYYEVAQPLE